MKIIKFTVIVPKDKESLIQFIFPQDRVDLMKRRGIDSNVIYLVDKECDDDSSIVIDARPASDTHFRMPDSVYSSLSEDELGLLIQRIRYSMYYLDFSDSLFIEDIRSLCEYYISSCSPTTHYNIFCKYTYATVGQYQYIDAKSIQYLNDVVKLCTSRQEPLSIDADYLGVSYYLLARNENDRNSKFKLLMNALSYFELFSLQQKHYPDAACITKYALALIEMGTMLNHETDQEYYAPYDKVTYVMRQMVNIALDNSKQIDPHVMSRNIDYLKNNINLVERRLSEVAPTEYHGQISSYYQKMTNNNGTGTN